MTSWEIKDGAMPYSKNLIRWTDNISYRHIAIVFGDTQEEAEENALIIVKALVSNHVGDRT